MAPKLPAKPAWWQAAAAFQPVRTPNFAERTVARHNPVTNTRRAHRRRYAWQLVYEGAFRVPRRVTDLRSRCRRP
jgi:hypothetical protein